MLRLAKSAASLCGLLLGAGTALAQTDTERPPYNIGPIILRDVKWQALPDEVQAVFIGPDGRTWHQMRSAGFSDTETTKRIIEREFGKESPQIYGASVGLFEPVGRVWFITDVHVLLGYDGHEWIQHGEPYEIWYLGACPGYNGSYMRMHNFIAAGTLFFPADGGILTVTNGAISYFRIVTEEQRRAGFGTRHVWREPDGLGALAVASIGTDAYRLYRWRKGDWTRVELPKPLLNLPSAFFAPETNGVWIFSAGRLFRLPYRHEMPAAFTKAVKRIADDPYVEREQATRDILEMGMPIIRDIENVLATTEDPEIRYRLGNILPQLNMPGTPRFGPYELTNASLREYDLAGRMVVAAEDILSAGKSMGPGLILKRGQEYRALPGKEFSENRKPEKYGDLWNTCVVSPRFLWTGGRSRHRTARLLDLDEGRFIDELPEQGYAQPLTIGRDGTLYAVYEGYQNQAIMAYKNGRPDERVFIHDDRVRIRSASEFCLASDGAVWCASISNTVMKFDGTNWHDVLTPEPPVRHFSVWLTAGMNGAMLLSFAEEYFFIQGGRIQRNKDLYNLISACREELAVSFKPPIHDNQVSRRYCPVTLVADAQSNIWVWMERSTSFRVLAGTTWLDVAPPLPPSGENTSWRPEYMAGLNGSVYIGEETGHGGVQGYYGQIVNGALSYSNAPSCEARACCSVYDAEGGLWIALRENMHAMRIKAKGDTETYPDIGVPVMSDKSGNIWLRAGGRSEGTASTTFRLLRDGKFGGQVKLPLGTGCVLLVSDRTGSVYAVNGSALYHLVAEQDTPTRYEIRETYTLEDIGEIVYDMKYSALGYLVISSFGDNGDCLRLIRVPPNQGLPRHGSTGK
jgi:hypothetical protein